ncbi:hypothetical protein AVEN_69941-1 [Araneus ventricosus]|uniref:Uncharacterized protein n=1 Tax=Araneus ventricosus TaxID=182803 RepID=A0A4Y2DA49_ARAVE|nr:hypothetical protein AVEN_69941-1 [Araneus ventricosus]
MILADFLPQFYQGIKSHATGVTQKFRDWMPARVPSLPPDHGPQLLGASANSPLVVFAAVYVALLHVKSDLKDQTSCCWRDMEV